jgi:hypothetical protein
VNKHVTLRKDANILSKRLRVLVSITNNPILVDPLTADGQTRAKIRVMMNGKRFKVRSLIRRFCDISEIFFEMISITPKSKCKNSE